MSFQNLIEVLGISHQDANEENPAENKDENAGNSPENAENQENAGVELPGEVPDADNPDITEEISSAVLTLDDVAVSDVTRDFVADVESVVFSRPDLVDVSKAASETTVGGIKESRGLEVQYSAELTEEQIAEINAQTVEAGDWALISMQPFESEETLTVTMKNGEQFVVKVTDAQIVTDSATFKTAERFVIAYVTDAGKYIVLTSTGYCEEFDTPEDIDFLDSKYLWRFYYVFTEKDQNAANANYEYYFIRPTEDLTKSIALIDASDTELIPRTNPDHRINLTTNMTQIVNKERFNPRLTRETPFVNVNELSFLQNDTEWTVYLGAEVDPKEQLKGLWRNILIEEVLKDTTALDLNRDDLPEIGKNQSGNLWYPLDENSIVDDRESQGIGERQTFKMNDLIKVLAIGMNYSWWDYQNSEPNWDEFLRQALNGGITIPYKVYGNRDNSNIVIKLKKTIADGEEDDLINKSPHVTAMTGDGVEQYTLTVKYSPDYTVLPRGQGGSHTGDIHTGTYGTLYQGHAAGTETSTNTNVINVFKKGSQITKTDEAYNQVLSGSEFKLFRTCRDGETTDLLTIGGNRYHAVATLDTSGGVATLDPLEKLDANEKYYLVETKAPAGYNLMTTPIEVKLDITDSYMPKPGTTAQSTRPATGIYDWTETANLTFVGSGFRRTDAEGTDNLTNTGTEADSTTDILYYQIMNNPGYELPNTGGPGTRLFTILGSILILGAGVLLWRRQKLILHG